MDNRSQYSGRRWLETLRILRLAGRARLNCMEEKMGDGQVAKMKAAGEKIESQNKALVLEAFDTLFNKRDYAAAEKFWSPDYIQHSAHIEPGREGLFDLIKSLPPTSQIRARDDRGRRRFCNRPRTIFKLWPARELDCSRHSPHSKRNPRRALGRHSG